MRIILLILTLFCLSGCMDAQCIDADDFGFAKFTVAAKQDKNRLFGTSDNQVSKWSNTGYSLTGEPLVVVVKNWSYKKNGNVEGTLSAWCPWYGSNSGASAIGSFFDPQIPPFQNALSYMSQGMAACKWRNPNDMCATTNSGDADITNAPCIFTQGIGLYALLTSKGYNPNLTVNNMRDPSGTAAASGSSAIAIHVGDPQNQASAGYSLYDINDMGDHDKAGGVVYNDVAPYLNGGLYFKILDKHYGDNSGQYLVIVKSGLDYNVPDPIQFITNLVATYFFGNDVFLGNKDDDAHEQVKSIITSPSNKGLIETLYVALIQNPYYKNIIRTSLSLYIILSGLYYLAGLLRITRSELMKRVVKIIIISILLDPNLGWKFFHDYLFVFFVEGVQFLISTIQLAAKSGPGSSSVLALMMAPETLVKLASLMFTTWIGIFYFILYMLVLVFLWSVMFKAAVVYLNCLIIIGMIIILGPIFLCFMLFSVTQSLYENWLKQLISYAIQPIILITIIAFMSMVIRHEIYTTLGFPVCKFNFPKVSDGGMGINNMFYWWVPSPNPLSGKGFSNVMSVIPVPEAHIQLDANGNETNKFCTSYECFENRYPQLPFLDPNSSGDMRKKDKFFGGAFIQPESLLLLVILIYLLNKATMSAEIVARAIAETSANATTLPEASIPYIPYDTPNAGGGGEGGSGATSGGGGGAPRPSIVKNDPLSVDSALTGKASVPTIGTGSVPLPLQPPPTGSTTKAPMLQTNGEPVASGGIKTGSKDDSFLPYKKPEMPAAKRSVDDMSKASKVTFDPAAEKARVLRERAAKDVVVFEGADKTVVRAKDVVVFSSEVAETISKPVLKSEGTKLKGSVAETSALVKEKGRVSLSEKAQISQSSNVKIFESSIDNKTDVRIESKDVFVMEPSIIERQNLTGVKPIMEKREGVVVSSKDIAAFRDNALKPISQKYSVSFEEVVERAPSPTDSGGKITLKENISSTVTYDLPERPDSISFAQPKEKAVVIEESIVIKDSVGNHTSFAKKDHATVVKVNSRKGIKRPKAPDYSNVASRYHNETTASKAQSDAAAEMRQKIKDQKSISAARKPSPKKTTLPKTPKKQVDSRVEEHTKARVKQMRDQLPKKPKPKK